MLISKGEDEKDKVIALQVLTMNNFDVSFNPPNASIHNVCWKSGVKKEYEVFEQKVECSKETTTHPYRYVAVWAHAGFGLHVLEIQLDDCILIYNITTIS